MFGGGWPAGGEVRSVEFQFQCLSFSAPAVGRLGFAFYEFGVGRRDAFRTEWPFTSIRAAK